MIDEKQWTDPEQTDPRAWLRHMAGLATLLQVRGPHRQRGMLARAAFENCRYNLVSSCFPPSQDSGKAAPEDDALHLQTQSIRLCIRGLANSTVAGH
jgi:hypothetical protein